VRFFIALLFLIHSVAFVWGNGSIIVLGSRGSVTSGLPNGYNFPKNVQRGDVLTEGLVIKTGQFAEVLLLFSNGTTATIDENSEFFITEFTQTPFKQSEKNLENWILNLRQALSS
jgi:hypothetical protein